MTGVDPPDREFLHFLWVKDPYKMPYEVMHLRFTRLVFGLRPSPAIWGQCCHITSTSIVPGNLQ